MYNRYSNPTVISCEFVGNEYVIADDDGGGGMNNYRSNPTLIDCSFKDNKSSGYGGGVLNSQSNPTFSNCTFINNSSTYNGGGMENLSSSPALTYCSFISNSAVSSGGAIYISGEFRGTSTDCLFEDNTAARYGGAILRSGPGELNIIRCEFRNSTANRGGVIYNSYSSLILSQCILEGNQAKYAGGIETSGDITLTNCLLANNHALEWGGALANMMNTSSRSINCTFVGNSADNGGAIFSNVECDTTVINSIFWDNTAQTGSHIATSGDHGGSTLTVNYCDIENGLDGLYVPGGCALNWGEDNIDAEPQFADGGNGDYRLSVASPCVDTGDNDSVPGDVCDIDGNTRIYDGDGDGAAVVDMGAYELGLLPLEVPMKLVPQSLNPGSHGKWIKAHFVLPEGFTVEDVDTGRPAEFEQFQLASELMEVFANKEDLVEIVAAFDRSAFCGIGPFEGDVAVVGYLTSGRKFRGTDTIKIVNNKLKYLGVLASHWLSVCSAPDWCSGADLDQDSEVNFVDFALLDGCCFEVIKD
jgi:predicted outer membrane repeat protein